MSKEMLDMEKPLISIITLTYKKFDYIYEAIDSVLNQTYPSIEYIVSDDGSPDFPKKEIENYIRNRKGKNIKKFNVISSHENYGTVKNINRAYQAATGEILVPLSADDMFYSEDVVDEIVAAFSKKKCNVLVTSRMACAENGKELRKLPSAKSEKYIRNLDTAYKQYLAFITDEFYNMASGSAMYIKKSFIDSWGYFDEKYILWEDGPFLTQYTRNNMISTAYEIISIKYRLGGVSNGNPHPLMRKDRELYNETDRVAEVSKIKKSQKRKIEYICKRYKESSWNKKLFLYLAYPDVMVEKVIYKIRQE